MITLDEVIEIASDWTNGFDEMSIEKQMLHYLKEYRSDMQMYAENQKYWEDELKQKIKDFGDAKERYIKRLKELDIGTLNEPLTWDELRTMEGKPVWVEMDKPDVIKAWFLICQIDDSFVWVADSKGKSHNFPRVCLDTGLWQAYRKEKS